MDILKYYKTQSLITNPGVYAELFDALPHNVADLRQVVQGIYFHYMAGEKYNYEIPKERLAEIDTRYVEKILSRIMELDNSPLTEPRPLEKRFIGCCHDAAILFCSMTRHQGVPTRTRLGFESYSTDMFGAGFNVDHEIPEYWDENENRWRLLDPDLSDQTIKERAIPFDVHDVPRDEFFVAGKAWQLCRNGKADPEMFGIGDLRGLWFIAGNLLQDLAALNKMEMLHWDAWGLASKGIESMTTEELSLLDRVAELTQGDNSLFHDIRAIYEEENGLRVPHVIKSYSPVDEPKEVTLPI